MSFPQPELPGDATSLKAYIEYEIAALRADVRRAAEAAAARQARRLAAAPPSRAAPGATAPPGESRDPGESDTPSLRPEPGPAADTPPSPGRPPAGTGERVPDGEGEGNGREPSLDAVLRAVPVSAALLSPVRDAGGAITDFIIRAGNEVRSTEWMEPAGRQVGQRLLRVRPGYGTTGLVAALAHAVTTGEPLTGLTVDYTEERHGLLLRAPLLHYAAPYGDELLVTWRPAHGRSEFLSLDAQYIASMGWGHWDLLSGVITWSETMHRIFSTTGAMPWSFTELCDTVLPNDVPAFAEVVTAVLSGEEPPWTRTRFRVHGEVRTLDLLAKPVVSTEGRPWAVYLVARDLTPQMRSRRRLAQTQRESERLRQAAAAERRIASVMREALLPSHSRELAEAGLTVAAAYLPAEAEAAVGGDWYKCRRQSDGRVLIAIGDAVGHGLDAVARMAQQRHALAGLAQTGASAGELTTWLNELVCGEPRAETATMIVGYVDGGGGVLNWACAGHPPPLVRRGSEVSVLDTDHLGPMLGAVSGYTYETASVPLRRGDLLLLYTDGVVERRGEAITEGIARLGRGLAANAGRSPEETLERLTAVYTRSAHDDDACLLAVHID
ncbi:PP2C family protein-serine/threonine phosphatase [Streptomyces sp. NPDC051018]|uniref:PP2C family protein-serine/threonine phosphatase n=1 Tax=Streptomyces sp. NPDC051018 TaxID=3365639 RepID=UPI0037AA7222